ncbi:MAG: nucleotidyltransferase substrate binding protein [Hyphomicrobiales bacterium]
MSDFTNLNDALKNLELFWQFFAKHCDAIDGVQKQLEEMGIVKAFEICYEAMMKSLRRHLVEELAVPELATGRKTIIRVANENGLFRDGGIEQWFKYINARSASSHEDSKARMPAIHALMPDFIDDAISLYQTMSGKSWT